MSKPDVTVEVGIFNGFQLDDPEFGVLDTGVLDGGIDYTEVPQGLVSVSTSRGRNRDIGKTSAGSLSVSLRNEDRFFDPLAGSAFSSLVRPRLPIRVSAEVDPVATGGTVSDVTVGGVVYRVHVFETVGTATFTVSKPIEVEYLIIGGGGGGGNGTCSRRAGGGGGAGGFLTGFTSVDSGASSIVVGGGGTNGNPGSKGGNSSAFGITALGGGGGGGYRDDEAPTVGGSGGGAGVAIDAPSRVGADGTSGQGEAGGNSAGSGFDDGAGGGGGAGSAAANAAGDFGTDGGAGLASSITGTPVFYAGGGGGGGGTPGDGGLGGGGAGGATSALGQDGFDGAANTGGGGGGNGTQTCGETVRRGGDGGSGVIIIRYPLKRRIFTGFVDDWDFTYTPGGQSNASVEATDGFSRFARNINGGGSAVVESSGARLERVLDQLEVNWPAADRDIDTGQATLAASVLEGNALSYMTDVVEQSELGLLFMSKSGDVAFRSRLLATVSDPVRFADDGLGVPFSGVEIEYGAEDLVNQAIITGPSGTAIVEDAPSQILYGITAEEIDTQVSTLAQQEGIAEFLISKYSVPELRVQGITVNMLGLSTAQVSDVLGLEIGDQVDLKFTPNGIPPAISVRSRIIGVSHDVGLASHFVSFKLEKLPFEFFVLDDAVFGKLDEADVVLGF